MLWKCYEVTCAYTITYFSTFLFRWRINLNIMIRVQDDSVVTWGTLVFGFATSVYISTFIQLFRNGLIGIRTRVCACISLLDHSHRIAFRLDASTRGWWRLWIVSRVFNKWKWIGLYHVVWIEVVHRFFEFKWWLSNFWWICFPRYTNTITALVQVFRVSSVDNKSWPCSNRFT